MLINYKRFLSNREADYLCSEENIITNVTVLLPYRTYTNSVFNFANLFQHSFPSLTI